MQKNEVCSNEKKNNQYSYFTIYLIFIVADMHGLILKSKSEIINAFLPTIVFPLKYATPILFLATFLKSFMKGTSVALLK
jgi:hypothetical protein